MDLNEEKHTYLSYKDLVNQLPSGIKPTYSQLLYTWEWVGFREEIKARDNFSCTYCGIATITQYTPDEKKYLLDKLKEEIKQEPYLYFGSSDENEKFARDQDGSISDYEFLKRYEVLRIKNEAIEPLGYMTKPEPRFEVHHKNYKFGALPWKYPSDWLITLCDKCHHKVHFENQAARKVYKDFNKREEIVLNKCSKCGGSGYIPEYNHINAGICYECWGYGGR